MVGVVGVRATPVHGIVANVMSVGEVVSAGWGVTMPVGCVTVQVTRGTSIS